MPVRRRELPSLEILQDNFYIDADGRLYHAKDKGHGGLIVRRGDRADTTVSSMGYRQSHVLGKSWYTHRIVFALANGRVPSVVMDVDHKDLDGLNNTPTNLREIPHSKNNQNHPGLKGVHKFKGVVYNTHNPNVFTAMICADYKVRNLGSYESAEEAARAYDYMSERLHGEFGQTNVTLGLLSSEGEWLEWVGGPEQEEALIKGTADRSLLYTAEYKSVLKKPRPTSQYPYEIKFMVSRIGKQFTLQNFRTPEDAAYAADWAKKALDAVSPRSPLNEALGLIEPNPMYTPPESLRAKVLAFDSSAKV